MRCSSILTLGALVAAVSARPVRRGKWQNRNEGRAASANTALVFQFANVLNQLEDEFYKQTLSKFQDADYTGAGFSTALIPSEILNAIQVDESTHIAAISQALVDNGAEPLQCNFKFDDALKDVTTMAATARTVEYVGVAAFLGGATLIDDPIFLDAAASILTIEARHQTLLNVLSGQGSAIPSAFDIPFSPPEVLAIAGGFIDGDCDIGIDAANPLTVTNTDPISTGTTLTFSGNNVDSGSGSGQFCQILTGGAPQTMAMPIDQCKIPDGTNGPVAVWITSSQDALLNNVVDRSANTDKQVAGPAVVFVDTQPETLGQMVRGGSSSNSGATTVETTTITPEQASSIISSVGQASPTSGSDGESNSNQGANGAAAPASTPLPPNFTGESPDKKTTVNGIQMVPRPASDGGSSSSASDGASSTDSAEASSTSA